MADTPDDTGFDLDISPAQVASAIAETPAAPEAAPVAVAEAPEAESPFIRVAEPPAARDLSVAARNEAFMAKIRAARQAPPAIQKPQPPIPYRLLQTKAEMEEGARQVAKHAEQRKAALLRKPTAADIREANASRSNPTYRPGDHVPGFDKGNVAVLSRPVTVR